MHGGADIAFQLRVIADDFHGAATQHERWADDEGVADVSGNLERLIAAARSAVMGLFEAKFVQQLLEPFTVFGQINSVRRGAEDRDALIREGLRQF